MEAKIEVTAYHEAGHAVAAWHLSLAFRRVTIKPDLDALGHVLYHKLPSWFRPDTEFSPRVRLLAEHHIITSLAGQVAEERYLGKEPTSGQEADNETAVNLAMRFTASSRTADAFLRYCHCVASDLVNQKWWAVEAIAGALLTSKTLSHAQALDVLKNALQDRMAVNRA